MRLYPTGVGATNDWFPSGAETTWEAVSFRWGAREDAQGITFPTPAIGNINTDFTFTVPPFTNPAGSVVPDSIGSITFRFRVSPVSGTVDQTLSLLNPAAATVATIIIPGSAPRGIFRSYFVVVPTKPAGGAWTGADLNAFTLSSDASAPSSRPIISQLSFSIEFVFPPGQGRTRREPARKDPPYVCAVDGLPYHFQDLLEVTDPRHPHYGLLVCKADYDEIDPEPPPILSEGDLDPLT